MKNEIDVLKNISQKFEKARIPYMLTGSMAMNFYAQPRMTRDIDVFIEIQHEDIETIVHLFGEEYYISREAVKESIKHQSMFNLIHNESVIKVDCIIRKNHRYRIVEFERRREITIGDFSTYIVSKEDLIISKLMWAKESHSEVQRKDIKNLASTGFDKAYLQNWIQKLGLVNVFKECCYE